MWNVDNTRNVSENKENVREMFDRKSEYDTLYKYQTIFQFKVATFINHIIHHIKRDDG